MKIWREIRRFGALPTMVEKRRLLGTAHWLVKHVRIRHSKLIQARIKRPVIFHLFRQQTWLQVWIGKCSNNLFKNGLLLITPVSPPFKFANRNGAWENFVGTGFELGKTDELGKLGGFNLLRDGMLKRPSGPVGLTGGCGGWWLNPGTRP